MRLVNFKINFFSFEYSHLCLVIFIDSISQQPIKVYIHLEKEHITIRYELSREKLTICLFACYRFEGISIGASKEMELKKELDAMIDVWNEVRFETETFR